MHDTGGIPFPVGQRVMWNGVGAVVTANGASTGFPSLRTIKCDDGEEKTVRVGSLAVRVDDPRDKLPADVRAVLEHAERVLLGPNGNILVSILRGCTRGPDNGDAEAKAATTAKLRGKAWGKAAGVFGDHRDGVVTAEDLQTAYHSSGRHFADNVVRAAHVFGEGE